jgi:hypothetical protein
LRRATYIRPFTYNKVQLPGNVTRMRETINLYRKFVRNPLENLLWKTEKEME